MKKIGRLVAALLVLWGSAALLTAGAFAGEKLVETAVQTSALPK